MKVWAWMPDFGGGLWALCCRGTAFQAAVCGACLRGLHPRLSRYRLPDGWAGALSVPAFAFMIIEVLPSRQQGVVCLSGGSTPGYGDIVFQTDLVACWSGGFTPVMEVPSSRRVAICTRVRFQTE